MFLCKTSCKKEKIYFWKSSKWNWLLNLFEYQKFLASSLLNIKYSTQRLWLYNNSKEVVRVVWNKNWNGIPASKITIKTYVKKKEIRASTFIQSAFHLFQRSKSIIKKQTINNNINNNTNLKRTFKTLKVTKSKEKSNFKLRTQTKSSFLLLTNRKENKVKQEKKEKWNEKRNEG